MSEPLCKCGHYAPEHDGPLDDGECLGNDLACPCMKFDPVTTPTTDAREREAKEAIAARLCVFAWSIDGLSDPSLDEVERQRIHDLAGWVVRERTAILDAERARVRAVVLSQPEVFVPMSMRVGRNDERYIDGANLLARLDAEPTP